MARETRLHIPNSLYHVSLRANSGQLLFWDKQDGYSFYQLLAEGQEKFGHKVLGVCLLDDQIHLAILINKIPLSKIIHNLTFRYTRYFNKQHDRHGHLFVGRYKSTLVQRDRYLPDLIRYLHLTPVRLDLVKKPEDYLWSSHRAYLSTEQIDWLDTSELLSHFDAAKPTTEYQEFILQGMQYGRPKDLAAANFKGRIFGDQEFVEQCLAFTEQSNAATVNLNELLNIVCHQYALTEQELINPGKQRTTSTARGILAYLVKQCQHISFTELAQRVGRDATTLSAHATRIEKRRQQDMQLDDFLKNIQTQILA